MYDSNETYTVFKVPRFRGGSGCTHHKTDTQCNDKGSNGSYKVLTEENYPQFEHSGNIFSGGNWADWKLLRIFVPNNSMITNFE